MTTTVEPLTKTAAPPPGFYRDIPWAEYASWSAVNSHTLALFRRTPAHVRYELLHGGAEPTREMDLGFMVHLATLEPERFTAEYVVPPKVDRRFKEDKMVWAKFCAENPGKVHISRDDYDAATSMREELLSHPTAGEFFRGEGVNELSLVWKDRETDVLCKARIDRVGHIGEWPCVGDIKTTTDASRRALERDIARYQYHTQGSHYLSGLDTLVPTPEGQPHRRYVLFVVESSPPHLVAVYELEDTALAIAEEQRQRYLRAWKRCNETGEWPGYPAGCELVSLPAWAVKEWDPESGD